MVSSTPTGGGGCLGLCCKNPSRHHFVFFFSSHHSPFSPIQSLAPLRISLSTNEHLLSPSSASLTLPSPPSKNCPALAIESSTLEEERQAAIVEGLWQQFFSDPSQWWDKRLDKGNADTPDFKHKTTNMELWINDRFSPSWLQSKLATVTQQGPQQSFSSSPSSARRISVDQESRRQLWEEFFSDPSQWWDNRSDKKSSRFPDFIHKTAKKALWIHSRLSPPWVHARLAAMIQDQEQAQCGFSTPGISRRVAKMLQLWQEYFSNPSEWWDNRFIKKSPKFPDFRHKRTHEGLWLEDWLNPPWVKSKLAAVAIQSGGELRSWVANSFGNGDNLNKLCQEGQLKEALHTVELMVQENLQVPNNTYASLLKGCTRRRALAEGKRVHGLIVRSGLDSDVFLGSNLVDMYAKCGSLLDAREVFNVIPEHNVISWTAIISAYADHGQGEEAINLFQQMQQTGIAPDKVTFVVVLKACAKIAALERGKQVHSTIIKSGFESNVMVTNTIVDMYAKCGCIEDAREVFNKMNERDVISWNTIIGGYAQQGLGKEALALYEQMKQEDVQPDNVTYVVLLKACASIAALEQGRQLHSHIIRSGFQTNVIVSSALVDMYAKCGCIGDAHDVFKKMNERDVVTWNAMITGYTLQGLGKEALSMYEQMKQEAVQPNKVTYIVLLKACASFAAREKGKQLHSDIIRSGFESDLVVGNTLVDMYAKCECIKDAREVFERMNERDVVSWNAMIAGYAQQGLGEEALSMYEQMKQEGMQPDSVTHVLLLRACACIAALEEGKQLHSHIIRSGLVLDVIMGSALIDMYAKCGCIEDARQVFNNMHERNVVSCNAMIAGYVQQGLEKEAFALYEQMKQEGVQADNVTCAILLKACASTAALEHGMQLHSYIIKSGFEADVIVDSALIDMYAKCGNIENARRVFNNMSERDVVSWSVLMAGYAQQGLGKEALTLLEQMQRESMKPNEVTYVSVLCACSHSGLVDEGRQIFDSMCKDHGVTPNVDHYACMVDLLGRAGCLVDAEDIINKMPTEPDAVVWMTLLGAARNHGHVEIGRRAFDCVVKLEPENDSAYVLLSNIYAAAGRMDEVAKIRKEMKDAGVKETPGCSWIEIDNQVHAFVAGEETHPQEGDPS